MCNIVFTVHLHEWCQFMVGSGRITVPDQESYNQRSVRSSTLADDELNHAYRKLIPQFDTLRNEYDKAL